MIAPARAAAVEALIDIALRRADLPHAVARLRARLHDRRDAALAAEIVSGTLRWRARLDALLDGAADRPMASAAPAVVAVLRAAAFQIDHLDRVPAHAVVHDAVALARALGHPGLAGFVNAVLRRLGDPRRRPALPPEPAADDPVETQVSRLAVLESHPEWLLRRWIARHGFDDALATARFNNTRPPLTVRVHRHRLSPDAFIETALAAGIAAEPCRFAPDGVVVAANAHLDEVTALTGCYTIQDEGSQLVACAVEVAPGQRVLDTCAAPGGKAMALAADAGAGGLVVAGDYRPKRVALLARLVSAGDPGVRVVRLDLGRGVPFADTFDRVLVDAPCSGLGTLRRDPDLKWSRREADLAGLAARQGVLLDRASEAVARGGRLVYATCSSEPDENEAVVDAFLAAHPGFALHRLPGWLAGEPDGPVPLVNARGELSTRPAAHGLESFFAAALARTR